MYRKQEQKLRTSSVFNAYIKEGYSARQLADQTQREEYRVRQDIQYRLDTNKIQCIDEIYPEVHYLMIDGYHLP